MIIEINSERWAGLTPNNQFDTLRAICNKIGDDKIERLALKENDSKRLSFSVMIVLKNGEHVYGRTDVKSNEIIFVTEDEEKSSELTLSEKIEIKIGTTKGYLDASNVKVLSPVSLQIQHFVFFEIEQLLEIINEMYFELQSLKSK